tara:strand:+ start:18909 stop:19268 length:360 start_codon:yes stop_codon:yes gene_type:complete
VKSPKRLKGFISPSHRRAPKQESEIAKRIKGRCTVGSGNKDEKGDVRLKGVCRIEAKTTKHNSFSVTQKILDQIETAALSSGTGELPVLIIEFIDEKGNPKRSVAVCPTWVLDIITQQK